MIQTLKSKIILCVSDNKTEYPEIDQQLQDVISAWKVNNNPINLLEYIYSCILSGANFSSLCEILHHVSQ
jgi:hypothetical protein